MRFKTLLAVLTVLLVCVPAVPASAKAKRGPCIVGTKKPRCDVQRGTARYGADDGDTIDVHLDGTRRHTHAHVRLTGVQAMELSNYRQRAGECRAVEATERVEALLKRGHKRVRLAVQNPESVSRKRPLRSIAVKVHKRYVDVGATLIEEGLGLWLPNSVETHFNGRYAELSKAARAKGAGLWDPAGCGAAHQEGIPLQVWVNANPPGSDDYHLDQEYVTIRNNDAAATLDLSGWWVRDSGLRRYTFAPGTAVAPGQTITVHVGRGSDSATDRFWGLKHAIFDNPGTDDLQGRGDGAYLFDPDGDIRASMIYPCRGECTDPLSNLVGVEAHPRGRHEYVKLVNVAPYAVNLQGYRLRYRAQTYAFGADSVLAPGEELRVDVQGYPEDDVHDRKSWGRVRATLRNGGGAVRLQTFDDVQVGCSSWGSGSCD